MKKKLGFIIALLISLIASLDAVDFVEGSGRELICNSRDSLAYYHNNIDELHWYGSDSWAVKFEFDNYFPDIDSLQFEATSIFVYIPNNNPDDEMTVKLTEDFYGQPDLENLLITQAIDPDQGWNQITFSPITNNTFWLVVDYQTNTVDQFMAASAIDGSHSYYRQDEYYFNMEQNGFTSEFLFSLGGTFLLEGVDIELVDFQLLIDENCYPNGTMNFDAYPSFTIRNNSNQTIDDAFISFRMTYPLWTINDMIYIDELQPQETISENYFLNESHKYDLLRSHSQYSVLADLNSEYDEFENNNSLEFYLNIFPVDIQNLFVENFIRINEISENIWNDQSEVVDLDSCFVLNVFSDHSDSLYVPDGGDRFNYYNLSGYPITIINGKNRIYGYDVNYPETFQNYYSENLGNNKTYIVEENTEALFNIQQEVFVTIELANSNTYIFEDYLADVTFYAAIVEDNILLRDDIFGSALLNIVWQESAPTLNNNESFEASFQFNRIYDVTPFSGNLNNCKILYWVQNDETKSIDFLNYIDFEDFELTRVEDDLVTDSPEIITISNNPFHTGDRLYLNVHSPEKYRKIELKIFNLKGQIVNSLQYSSEDLNNISAFWDGRNRNENFVASGIYLLKISLINDRKDEIFYRSCLFLK